MDKSNEVVEAEVITDAVPMTVEHAAELLAGETMGELVALHRAEVDATILANELGGKIKQADLIEAASRLAVMYDLERIKQSKGYKGAQVRHVKTGELVSVFSWDGYCEAIGRDRKAIDEELKNLAFFGDNLIKLQDSHGIGYRSLRRIRAGLLDLTPEEQQTALVRLTGAEDKEEVLGLVDELSVKLAAAEKEKTALKETLKAQERVQTKTSEARDKASTELEKMLKIQADDPEKLRLEREAVARKDLAEKINVSIGQLGELAAFCAAILAEGDGDFLEHVNGEVGNMCITIRNQLLNAGLDVDFGAAFNPELTEEE